MIWLFFILAVLWRFQDLGLKAVHHDESINGWFVMQIWGQGWFQYDPNNYHGPLFSICWLLVKEWADSV